MSDAEPKSLQGLVASGDDETQLIDALENAFDYRGDVTITTTAGETVDGYLFDRSRGETLADSYVRIMPAKAEGPEKRTILFSQIAQIEFTGKDAAHGKSFETWIKKFTEKKLAEARAAGYISE